MSSAKEKHDELMKNFADELIKQIENNNAAWQKPWTATEHQFTLPLNKDGKEYQGRNMLLLWVAAVKNGYKSDRWYTFNGAKELGGKVKKGEKSSQIVRWQFTEEKQKLDGNGKPVFDDNGKPVMEQHKLDKPRGPFIHHVFNGDQIEGLPEVEKPKLLEEWERHARAEAIIENAKKDGIDIVHRAINRAFYSPAKDQIVMPERHQFASADLYYATLLHEIGHATGHQSRLNRDLTGSFGSKSYAKEELRAEISSMIIGQELQIGHDPSQHQSYLKSWVEIVKEDPNAIFEAVKDAERIKEYLLGLEKEYKKEYLSDMQNQKENSNNKDEIIYPTNTRPPVAVKEDTINLWQQYLKEGIDNYIKSDPAADYASGIIRTATIMPAPAIAETLGFDQYKTTGSIIIFGNQIDNKNIERENLYHLTKAMLKPIAVNKTRVNSRSMFIDLNHHLVALTLKKDGQDIHIENMYDVKEYKKIDEKSMNKFVEANTTKAFDKGTLIYTDVEQMQKHLKDEMQYILDSLNSKQNAQELSMDNTEEKRTYLYVPFADKDQAKELGAKWDNDVKQWYVPEGVAAEPFKQWAEPPKEVQIDPITEFRQFLESYGANVPSGHPVANGKWQRLHIEGDKSHSKNAAYIANDENGVIRGYFNNFKTGEQVSFTSSRQNTYQYQAKSAEEIAKIRQEKDAEQAKIYASTAEAAKKILEVAPAATHHPYLEQKGVQAYGLYIVPDPSLVDQNGNIRIAHDWREAKQMREDLKGQNISVLTKGDLIIPAYNAQGDVTTLQTISQNNFKSYLKDGQKTGSSLTIGTISSNKPILIAEGYATAATLHEQLKQPVVVAFDSGNLKSVALSLREQYPDNTLYLAADNDHVTEREKGINTGITKAMEAANLVGGYVVAPKFAEHETGSDWNDLYKSQGAVELRDQFRSRLVDIQAEKNLDLSINKVQFDDKEKARVQDIVMGKAFKDPERLIKEYTTDVRTFNGRYIASDMMKEVFIEFSQSPEHRNRFNNAVHNTAAALAAKHFENELHKPIENGRDTVVFLTGSPGAGKTSSVLNEGSFPDHVKVIFEGQLANAHQNPATISKIQQAIDKGLKVEITAVNPKPEQALENTFKRFADPADGRGAPISTMARIQGNTYDGLKYIHDKFGDQVSLTIVDKPNDNQNEIKYTGWQHLDVLKSQGTEAEIKQRLETHLTHQYSQGKINDECFKQAAGGEHHAKQLLSRMVRSFTGELKKNEPGRSLSSGSGEPSNQLGEKSVAGEIGSIGRMGETQSKLHASKSGVYQSHRQPEINRGSEPAQAGRTYSGNIISVGEDVTLQRTPTGKIIVHETENLPGIKEQDTGSRMKIVYGSNGKGDIVAKANDLEIGKQKELDKNRGFER